jgi:hypothetical protein
MLLAHTHAVLQKQWAAVMTHILLMSAPPQENCSAAFRQEACIANQILFLALLTPWTKYL